MNSKLVLTSLIAIAVASPAMADLWNTSGAKQDLMEVNKTYTGAATVGHMGVSENSGTATAAAYYEILPGYYLPANSYTAATCTAGNYCPGVTPAVTMDSSAQGLESCPTGYTSSDSSSDSIRDCYTTTCTTSQHAATGATYSGRVYYGGLNNCAPSACEDGYTLTNISASTLLSGRSVQSVNSNTGSLHTGTGGTSVSSGWSALLDNGDTVYGGWTCTNAFHSTGDLIGTVSAAESGVGGDECFCFLNSISTTVDGYRRNILIDSLAVKASADSSFSGFNSCTQGCGSLCANNFLTNGVMLSEHASNTDKCIARMFTITYSCGTGEGIGGTVPDSQNVIYLTSYTSRQNTCTRTGYRFDKWWVSNTGAESVAANTSATWNYTENKTFSADWLENSYTVVYNKNDNSATGTMSNSPYTYTESKALASNTFTNGTKQFLGWATASDGSVAYSNAEVVSKLTATHNGTVNLYAVWGDCAPCNAGTGATCTLSANNGVCTYTTACQNGYNTLTGGGTATPSCTGNTITLTWNNGGHGTAPSTPVSCTYGSTFNMPAALTDTGYTFNKWNVNNKTFNGGQTGVACNYTNLNTYDGSATITASWTTNKINIVWNGIENASIQTADNKDMTNFDSSAHTAQSQVDYDGNIYTPKAAMAPTGQTFVGWKFVK